MPEPISDPDVAVLVATALSRHRVLRGPALETVVPPVTTTLLRQAVRDLVPAVLEGVEGEERFALLTLARIVVTVETGRIVGKDEAVDAVIGSLPVEDRWILARARAGYRGEAVDDWRGMTEEVVRVVQRLARRAVAER